MRINRWIATHPSASLCTSIFLGLTIGYSLMELANYMDIYVFKKGLFWIILDWYCNN